MTSREELSMLGHDEGTEVSQDGTTVEDRLAFLEKRIEKMQTSRDCETDAPNGHNVEASKERMALLEEKIQNLDLKDDGETFEDLQEDTFSFFSVYPKTIPGIVFPTVVFIGQIVALSLCLINLMAEASPYNPFGIPAKVDWPVTASQVLCIMMTMATQQDYITSLIDLYDGPRKTFLFGDDGTKTLINPSSTRFMWMISNSLRFVQGAVGILVSCVLIFQSEAVIDLYFNFAALTFISELDNTAFWLVDKGYLLKGPLKGTMDSFRRTKVLDSGQKRRSFLCCPCSIRSLLLPFSCLLLFFAWFSVFMQQETLKFFPQNIRVQVRCNNKILPSFFFSFVLLGRCVSLSLFLLLCMLMTPADW